VITKYMYVNRSVCTCGFSVLYDHIPLGTEYEVDADSVQGGYTYGCGGCGMVINNVTVIRVRDEDGAFRPLPLALFEPVDTVH
jgi:hypothetical protein